MQINLIHYAPYKNWKKRIHLFSLFGVTISKRQIHLVSLWARTLPPPICLNNARSILLNFIFWSQLWCSLKFLGMVFSFVTSYSSLAASIIHSMSIPYRVVCMGKWHNRSLPPCCRRWCGWPCIMYYLSKESKKSLWQPLYWNKLLESNYSPGSKLIWWLCARKTKQKKSL